MAFNAHDIQVCLWKILKLFSKTCVTYSLKHPFLSFSMLCLFLLYIAFPLVFWVVIYSFPLVVCTSIILSIPFNIGDVKKHKDEDKVENDGKYSRQTRLAPHDSADKKKPFARVHSVRRRRAKEFRREDNNNNMHHKVEDKNTVSSTNINYDMVDKNALTEENSPKEIREVEVVDYSLVNSTKSSSCSASQSTKYEFDELGYQSFEDGNNSNNNNKAMQGNGEDDYQKNKMDVGISDSERNKRLESLIARRRSRRLLSVEVKRILMNMDRNDHHQISSIVIPKNNNTSRLIIASNNSVVGGGPISPSPGSAPSVLIPMRNPFDLPYDLLEEKPDLTGDSFEQEFMSGNNNRDMMFCRHESFSLGPFLPGEFDRNRKEISSSVPDSRFRLVTSSSLGYQFNTKPAGNEFDKEFTPIVEHELYEASESKPTIASPQDDHIKEIIQVHENGSQEDDIDEVQTRPTPEEDASRSPTSSEEDAPVFKIDREAILKSLSSMAQRNSLQEQTDNNNNNNNNINNNEQIGEHLNRLNSRFYYADRTAQRHTASYSIASDLQVEVSEVSSPPLTIDENLSYIDYDEDNHSTYDEDSWAGSSHFVLSQELRSAQVDEISKQDTALLAEKHCAHPWCAIAEFPDSCQTTRATNLDEKIDKTLQRSFSLAAHTSNRNDSKKPEECSHDFNEYEKELNAFDAVNHSKTLLENNTNQIEESATIEPKTEGQFEKLDECHDMEHSPAESVKSSDDSNERLETEHLEMIMASAIVVDQNNLESIQHSEDEQSSFAQASITRAALGSNVQDGPSNLMPNVAFEIVQTSLPSPKSVLHPTCSVASFDHYIDDEVHQFNAHTTQVSSPIARQNSTAFMEHSAALRDSDGEEAGVFEESSEPSNSSTADDVESPKQQKIHENGLKQEETACGSSRIPSSHEEPAGPIEETSSTSLNNDEVYSNNSLTTFRKSTYHSDDSNSPPSSEEKP